VAESNIAELEITEADGKVRIVKSPGAVPLAASSAATLAQGVAAQPEAAATASPAPEDKVVKAPMVGTFYRAGGPGKPPFVEVGQTVKASDAVCIIEAMKLLNEIEAGFDGVVKEVLVENGQPVEYGQPLIIIA